MFGDYNNNTIQTYAGEDIVYTVGGNNTVYLGDDDDVGIGYNGVDFLLGESGNDFLEGHFGDDTLAGGSGSDNLRGGRGDDILIGGTEADNFFWGGEDALDLDEVIDFEIGIDRIVFDEGFLDQDAVPGPNHINLLSVSEGDDPDNAVLSARTEIFGWQEIAVFHDTSTQELLGSIYDGSLFEGQVSLNPELGGVSSGDYTFG